MARRLV